MAKIEDARWEHAKVVANRCAERFSSRTEIERYLAAIGWDWDMIERMMKYLDRKERMMQNERKENERSTEKSP